MPTKWMKTSIKGIHVRSHSRGSLNFRVMDGAVYVGSAVSKEEAIQVLVDYELPIIIEDQAAQEIETFKRTYPLFSDWIPSDLQHVKEVMMDSTNSIIWFFPLIFRDALLKWFHSLTADEQQVLNQVCSHDPKQSLNACRSIHNGLKRVLNVMVHEDRTWFNVNVNANISHHSGWIPLLLQCKILQECCETKRDAMNFGSLTSNYCMQPLSPSIQNHLKELYKKQMFLNAFEVCESFEDYKRLVKGSQLCGLFSFNKFPTKPKKESYTSLWTKRGTIEAARFQAGISKFHVPAGIRVIHFAKIFPDQNQYLVRWAKHLKVIGIHELAHALGYKGPLHLLSMFACVLMDGRIRMHSTQQWKTKGLKKSILKPRFLTRNSVGHEAHPCQAILRAMSKDSLW